MARPKKNTIDWFPHDVRHGRTMFIMETRFGNDGYAFWFKLLEYLGDREGHFIDCGDESEWQFLLAKARVDGPQAENMLTLLATLDAIDKKLWRDRKVVWCQNLVDRIAEVYAKRKQGAPVKPVFAPETPHDPQFAGQKPDANKDSRNSNDRKQGAAGIPGPEMPESRVHTTPLISPQGEEAGESKQTRKPRGKRVKILIDYEAEITRLLDSFAPDIQSAIKTWAAAVASLTKGGKMSEARYYALLGQLADISATTGDAIFKSAILEMAERKVDSINYLKKIIHSRTVNKGTTQTATTSAPAGAASSAAAPGAKHWVHHNGAWKYTHPDGTIETLTDEEFEMRRDQCSTVMSALVSDISEKLSIRSAAGDRS